MARAVTCPLHNWVISLETGQALGADEGSVRRPSARRSRGREILIDLSDARRRGRRADVAWMSRRADAARPAPIAASAAACSLKSSPTARSPCAAIRSIRPISAGSAPRARRSARRSASTAGCLRRRSTAGARAGTRRSISSPTTFSRDDRRARARLGRLLRLRPVADRGLLRRQQADEGFYRLGQYRHQFAPLHGLLRRRATAAPSARTRCRELTRIWNWPISSCSSAPTSPGAIRSSTSASRRRSRRGRRCASSSIDPRRTMTADIADLHLAGSRLTATSRCSTACSPWLATDGRLDRAYIERLRDGLRGGARRSGSQRPCRHRGSDGDFARRPAQPSTNSSPRRRRPSPSTARASTSPRPGPTRSTPSSTAIWRRAVSASPAWGPSRSPASRTRWAGARSAASPTCSPRIWTSRIPSTARACRTFGARRA